MDVRKPIAVDLAQAAKRDRAISVYVQGRLVGPLEVAQVGASYVLMRHRGYKTPTFKFRLAAIDGIVLA